jgi:hypothetical protein
MEPNWRQTLTQEELVADLRALGYTSASVTSIAAWRKVDLLPQFSSGGRGQGRGAGRDKSLWSNPTDVLNQAVALMDLRKSYRHLEELYLPLWQLGFPIPSERVRPALIQPLLTTVTDFNVQEDGRSAIEDLIDQSVADISPLIKAKIPLLDVPDETLSAVVNVLANPEYDFTDQPYEDGVSELKIWERSFAQRCQELLKDSVTIDPEVVGDNNNIFANAPFINKYLSLPRLVEATQNCSDAALLAVQRDLQFGRQILLFFKRIIELLSPFLPATFRFSEDDVTVLFNFGTMMIWVDLAMRRSGFGPLIDYVIPKILDQLHKDFDEAAERQLTAAGPEIGKAMQAFEQIMMAEVAAAMAKGTRVRIGEG